MQRSEEEVKRAYTSAPKVIQDALSDGPAVDFMVALQERYNLHIDVAGTVVEKIRDLLLGLSNPTEFLGELINLGIQDTVARSLVTDLNTEVFMPLRDRIREEGTKPAPVEPEIRKPLPPPAIEYQAPATPAPVTLPGSPVSMHEVAAPQPAPVATPVVAHPVEHQPASVHPQGWHPAAAVHIYVPQNPAQAAQHHVVSAPVTTPQAVSAPIIHPQPVERPVQTAAAKPPTPIQAPAPVAPPSYANDPYREPI